MMIGCCVNMLPPTRLAGAEYSKELAAAGYDYVEMPMYSLSRLSEAEFREAEDILVKSGIASPVCNQFMTGEYKIAGPKEILTPVNVLTEYMDRAFERVGKNGLGVRIVVFGSPWSRKCPEGWEKDTALEQVKEFLRTASVYAEKHGITIAIENNNRTETNIMNRMEDVFDMVRRVDSPLVKALFDYYHVRFEGDDPAAEFRDGAELIVHTHISKLNNRDWFTDLSGEESYVIRYADILREADYEGGISMEAPVGEKDLKNLIHKTIPVLKRIFK